MTRSFVATPRSACIAVQPWDRVAALLWPVPVLNGAERGKNAISGKRFPGDPQTFWRENILIGPSAID